MNHSSIPTCKLTEIKDYLHKEYNDSWHILEIKDEVLHRIGKTLTVCSKQIIENEKFYIKESRIYDRKYYGLSLQHDGDLENAKYKSVKPLNGRPPIIKLNDQQIENYIPKKNQTDFLYLNKFATDFDPFIKYFLQHDILLERGRLLKLKGPISKHVIHADNDIRLHFPIITNESCIFFFYDKDMVSSSYHLKEGSFFLFNAWINHSFVNLSNQERTHLIFTLWNKN